MSSGPSQLKPSHDTRTFELSDSLFADFQALTLRTTGIQLDDTKTQMILTRFSRRVRALGLDGFEQYLEIVQQENHPERAEFIDTITTNLTFFFREPHHFAILGDQILPLLQSDTANRSPIRIWSAGCSSGQEPYSIAMSILESQCVIPREIRILCTDIDSKKVRQTELGQYSTNELRGLTPQQVQLWFDRTPGGALQVKQALKDMLVCRYMNLFGPWPIRPGVDVIFCRNVLIYFDVKRQEQVIRGMANLQPRGGKLLIGHSETIPHSVDLYRRISNTVYERV